MKKSISAALVLLIIISVSLSGCRSMKDDGKTDRNETTTESKLKDDADKIKDDVSEAASDAGEKIKEKFSEAGSTVKEGIEEASEDLSRITDSER